MNPPAELKGIWAGLPTPWNEKGTLDADALAYNVSRCASAGAHGVYILSPAGEFWSIDIAEFRDIAAVFADAGRAAGIPAQVFCAWHTTKGVIERLQCCRDLGFKMLQVGCPSWYGLAKEEALAFFADVSSACPDVALIHYNSPRQNWQMTPDDYLRVKDVAPNLVGTKSVSWNFGEILALVRRTPHLAHFYPEVVLLPAMLAGAKGSCSSAFYFNPETMMRLYNAIIDRRCDEAIELTASLLSFYSRTEEVFYRYSSADATYDALVTHLAGFLRVSPSLRRPHLTLPGHAVAEIKKVMDEFPEWNWSATHPNDSNAPP